MNPTLASLLGGLTAILGEYLYRITPGPWYRNLWMWLPLTLLVSFCVHELVKAPGMTLVGAFVVWTFATLFARVAVCVFVLHDHVTPGTWCALALIVFARIIQQVWK